MNHCLTNYFDAGTSQLWQLSTSLKDQREALAGFWLTFYQISFFKALLPHRTNDLNICAQDEYGCWSIEMGRVRFLPDKSRFTALMLVLKVSFSPPIPAFCSVSVGWSEVMFLIYQWLVIWNKKAKRRTKNDHRHFPQPNNDVFRLCYVWASACDPKTFSLSSVKSVE